MKATRPRDRPESSSLQNVIPLTASFETLCSNGCEVDACRPNLAHCQCGAISGSASLRGLAPTNSSPNLRHIAGRCFLCRQCAKNLIDLLLQDAMKRVGPPRTGMASRERGNAAARRHRLRFGRQKFNRQGAVRVTVALSSKATLQVHGAFLADLRRAVGRAVGSKGPGLETKGRAKPRMRLN